MPPLRLIACLCLLNLALPRRALAEAGVLVPSNVSRDPDARLLGQKDLDVTVTIDHLHVEVRLKQIFENRSDQTLEGRYVLALGERASVADFAVWDGEERLRGVVVERQHGRQLFEKISAQRIDPGLAETEDDPQKGRQFALRVSPIPPRGTARVEVLWTEELPLSAGGALFTLPLSPRRGAAEPIDHVRIEILYKSAWPVALSRLQPEGLFRSLGDGGAGTGGLHALWEASGAALSRDVTLELRFAGPAAPRALAFRDPRPRVDLDPFGGGAVYNDRRGFFLVQDLFSPPPAQATPPRPRDLVFLLDTSLSMAGEKLERAFAGLSHLLGQLRPTDRFELVLYGDEARPLRGALAPATSAAVAEALRAVRGSYLGGGTALSTALATGAALLGKGGTQGRYLVLLGDGQASRGELSKKALLARAAALPGQGLGLFVLAVGDDANVDLLRPLAARGGGAFAWVREGGGGADFAVRALSQQIGQAAWQGPRLSAPGLQIEQILSPSSGAVFAGGDALLVGRYRAPGRSAARLSGSVLGRPYGRDLALELPAEDRARPWIGRLWAALRVDELVAQIGELGEKEPWIQEIIALGKQFHLVTPYTSFLAAPRALLRPRSIQPGDPVLRVRVGRDITRVAALFPFGLQKALRYLPEEDLWETRFLAPPWMTDGRYQVTLVLTDSEGRKHREEKSFLIDSRAPSPRLRGPLAPARPGATLALLADADADVRRLEARLGDGPPVALRWDPGRKGSSGTLPVPADLPPGTYPVTLLAEDFAHNVATYQAQVDVLVGGAP